MVKNNILISQTTWSIQQLQQRAIHWEVQQRAIHWEDLARIHLEIFVVVKITVHKIELIVYKSINLYLSIV